jgi:hypothetical protein
MNQSEINFDALKRLLKLKQREVPPPGYFEHFSRDVISRIRAGEAGGGQTVSEKLGDEVPWLVRLLQIFETKPGLVGAFATSLCLLLVLGVLVADHTDSTAKDILLGQQAGSPETSLASLSTPAMGITTAVADESGIAVSTNPVISLQPTASLFGQQNPLFQPASFAPAGQ